MKKYYYFSLIHEKNKDLKSALSNISKAIELDNKNSEYYFLRAQFKIMFKLKKSGCEDYQKAFHNGKKEAYDIIIKECNN